jgi:hypothetical protein
LMAFSSTLFILGYLTKKHLTESKNSYSNTHLKEIHYSNTHFLKKIISCGVG